MSFKLLASSSLIGRHRERRGSECRLPIPIPFEFDWSAASAFRNHVIRNQLAIRFAHSEHGHALRRATWTQKHCRKNTPKNREDDGHTTKNRHRQHHQKHTKMNKNEITQILIGMAILIVSYCFLWRLVVPDSSLVAGEVQLRSSRRRADETPSVVRLVVFPTPRRQQS